MSNTYKHKSKGILGRKNRARTPDNVWTWEDQFLWFKAFGRNCHHRESKIVRHFSRKKFRAQSKEMLIQAETDPDNTSFPLEPRTQVWGNY